ncbi:MAG: signal recognition particle protein [bacterium]|nr:signal recognition particle protein [bacterium]
MFESLTTKLEATFKRLNSRGRLSETDIAEAMEDIRTSLLEADVNFQVTKDFCDRVAKKCLGREIQKSLSPGQTVVKYVYEELLRTMGERGDLALKNAPPVVIMLVGLQGSGKTTSCGKLARYLKEDMRRRPLLVPADVYRPAAIEQLKTLGAQLGVEVFPSTADMDPVQIAQEADNYARRAGLDTIIIDTAGRLQIDRELMNELAEIVEKVDPHEILLVADAMTGQEAVNVAKGFDETLDIDGLILTKMDGDARGGAALSMRAITGKPVKFIGLGEKLDALEVFHPDRISSRILGMGDMLSFIEKAAKEVDVSKAKLLQKKLKTNDFSLMDFYDQMQSIKKMGSIASLMQMIPGGGKLTQALGEVDTEKEMKHVEAIILSMTKAERDDYTLIDGGRRLRIARGSGTSVEEVNRLLKNFSDMRKVMKKLMKSGPQKGLGALQGMLQGGMPRGLMRR